MGINIIVKDFNVKLTYSLKTWSSFHKDAWLGMAKVLILYNKKEACFPDFKELMYVMSFFLIFEKPLCSKSVKKMQ